MVSEVIGLSLPLAVAYRDDFEEDVHEHSVRMLPGSQPRSDALPLRRDPYAS